MYGSVTCMIIIRNHKTNLHSLLIDRLRFVFIVKHIGKCMACTRNCHKCNCSEKILETKNRLGVLFSVNTHQRSRSSVETAERIKLGFGMGASFRPSYTVLKGNSDIFKIRVFSSGSMSQTPDLENFTSVYRAAGFDGTPPELLKCPLVAPYTLYSSKSGDLAESLLTGKKAS